MSTFAHLWVLAVKLEHELLLRKLYFHWWSFVIKLQLLSAETAKRRSSEKLLWGVPLIELDKLLALPGEHIEATWTLKTPSFQVPHMAL